MRSHTVPLRRWLYFVVDVERESKLNIDTDALYPYFSNCSSLTNGMFLIEKEDSLGVHFSFIRKRQVLTFHGPHQHVSLKVGDTSVG